MKKLVIGVVAIVALFASASSVYAIAYFKTVDNESYVRISNYLIDDAGVVNYKFIDGKVTCYGSFTKPVNGLGGGNSISCVK